MDFKQLLTALVERVEGTVAAFFCMSDGIGVENVITRPDVETTVTEVELATALKVVTDVSQNLALGRVYEVIVETEKVTALLEKVKEDYFLCLLLKPGGNVGRGRIELKKFAAKLNQEV